MHQMLSVQLRDKAYQSAGLACLHTVCRGLRNRVASYRHV